MNIEKQKSVFTYLAFIMLGVVVAVPVLISVVNNKRMGSALKPEIINDMKLDIPIQVTPIVITSEFAQTGARSVQYSNIGSSIVTPARYNLNTFGDKDFQLLGMAQWGLLNTVFFNVDDPDVVRYVFNNAAVSKTFLSREDVKNLVYDPKTLYTLTQNEEALNKFFNYMAVQAALNNPQMVQTIAQTRLMDEILRAPAAQYFLKNPKVSATVINKSPTLSALKKNPAVVKALRDNKQTSKWAATILK